MTFCTAINCIDGRTHLPVISFLTKRFNCTYVDLVTEPGPNRLIAKRREGVLESIKRRVDVSVDTHQSRGIGIAGHADCAGNPSDAHEQREHLAAAVRYFRAHYPEIPVIAIWVDRNWTVSEIDIT